MATYFGMPYFGMPYYGNLLWHDKIWQLILARKMATYFGMPNYGNLFWHAKLWQLICQENGNLFWHAILWQLILACQIMAAYFGMKNVLTEWQEKLHFLKYAKFQNRVRVL